MTTINQTSDTQTCLSIIHSNDHYFGGADQQELERSVEQGIKYGAFVDNQMVGCIVFKKLNNEAYEIDWFAIHPNYQGQGIGSNLLETTIGQLPSTCKLIEVKTLAETDPDPGYARTRKFYIRHGFIPLEIIHPYPGWGDDNPCQIFVKVALQGQSS